MTNPQKPLPPNKKKSGEVPADLPDTDQPVRELPEGAVAGNAGLARSADEPRTHAI